MTSLKITSAKILNKILGNRVFWNNKRKMYYNQGGLFQGYRAGSILRNLSTEFIVPAN